MPLKFQAIQKQYGDKDARCTSEARLDGKTVIVTGASSGIGLETARDLAKRGAKVIMAVRNLEKAKPVLEDIVKTSGNENVHLMTLDLCSMKSVVEFAKEFKSKETRLDILVCNAGVFLQPRTMTDDGFEQVWQANYLGHFLLTKLLLDVLKQSAPSRIVSVSSNAHRFNKKIHFDDINGERKYDHLEIYGQSKLAQILFTRKMASLLTGTGVSIFALNPGGVKTGAFKSDIPKWSKGGIYHCTMSKMMDTYGMSAEEGAQTSIHCAVAEGLEEKSGEYFFNCDVYEPKPWAKDDEMAEKLWDFSNEQVKPFI